MPKEVLVSQPIDQLELIQGWLSGLRGKKTTIRVPTRGHGARLLQLALKNAHDALSQEEWKSSAENPLERIAQRLHLPDLPNTVEGYDISNVSGSEPVGVKVFFRDGQPDKSMYRLYKMRGFTDQDDPGMIYQTIARRLRHRNEEPMPDLLLIDGGKSQLNAACAALKDSLDEPNPAVVAIAKVREEGDQERFYLPNRKNPVIFPRGDAGLMLLMRIRDEAHRFAHSSHTRRRKRAVIRSGLDDVPGIGPKKRTALLRRFGSVKALLDASDESILIIPGITAKDLRQIRDHFMEKPLEVFSE